MTEPRKIDSQTIAPGFFRCVLCAAQIPKLLISITTKRFYTASTKGGRSRTKFACPLSAIHYARTMNSIARKPLGVVSAGNVLRSFLLAAAVCLGMNPTAAPAQDSWQKNGKLISGDPSKARSKGFAVFQIATLDGEGFVARWNTPTAGVEVAETSTVVRNQPVFTFIVFTGCVSDQSGKCNVTADFRMFDPTGKSFGEQIGVPVWVGLPPPAKDVLQLSSQYLGMVVNNQDSLGGYRIVATVTDHVSGISLTTEQTIVAKPAA